LNEESSDILIEEQYIGFAPLGGRAGHILGLDAVDPAFSPSGRRIAYADDVRGGIWLTRPGCRWPRDRARPLPCSRLRRLTGFRDKSPAWSPDGKRIAFARGSGIHTVAAAGGDRRFLMRGGDPDWSAKGDIAFRRGGIRVRTARGTIRTLTEAGADPSWAPAGDRITFAGDERSPGGTGVYVVSADGSSLRKLWSPRDEASGPLSPTWSPDGRVIAFVEDLGGGFTGAIRAVTPSGRALRLIDPRLQGCRRCSRDINYNALSWQPLP
jgi:Tol biopolymer transport system component